MTDHKRHAPDENGVYEGNQRAGACRKRKPGDFIMKIKPKYSIVLSFTVRTNISIYYASQIFSA